MTQTKTQSVIESVSNVAIGYVVAFASQLFVFPLFDIHVTIGDNIGISIWFTVISLIRSYIVRRWFAKRGQ